MLHVDVNIPVISKSYEFSLNEHTTISTLIEEIANVISQKEQREWTRGEEKLILCNLSDGHMLPEGKTLHQCQVLPGSRLMLL